jgi:hypothetical protein
LLLRGCFALGHHAILTFATFGAIATK